MKNRCPAGDPVVPAESDSLGSRRPAPPFPLSVRHPPDPRPFFQGYPGYRARERCTCLDKGVGAPDGAVLASDCRNGAGTIARSTKSEMAVPVKMVTGTAGPGITRLGIVTLIW